MALFIICKFTKSRLFVNRISSELISYNKYKLKNNSKCFTDYRFFTRIKLPCTVLYSAFEKLPLRSSNYLLQIGRKNHFQPKLVFKPVRKSEEKKLLHKQLLDSLKTCKTVEEQIKVFYSLVKLTDSDINCRYSICQDLETVLQSSFPLCSVHLIGSSVNNLGIKGCDVDLSLQFSNENACEQSTCVNEEGQDAKRPVNKVYTSKNQLLTIKKILQSLKYDEPLVVIPGRCPILNFTAQNLSCDLAVSNSSAFYGTKLILLCGQLDERVVPLIQIIIYWAKHSNLVGGPLKFKSYAISLMVIYFLQTRSPPVLPSVKTMFDKTEFLKNLDNWSYDVKQYLNKFEKTKNNQTIEQLLKEFFFFYGNFDFSHIICPMSSSSIDRKFFAAKIDCSNKFDLNTICIQDPLDLEWNVTTGVNWKNCKNFLKAIISVWEKYQDQNCWIPRPQHWGLASLINNEFSYDSLNDIKEFCINIPITATVVDNFVQGNIINCLERSASNLKYILSYCLQFQCYTFNPSANFSILEIPPAVKTVIENLFFKNDSIYDSPKENFVIPMDNFKNNPDPYLVIRYICATQDTWSGRNTYMSLCDSPKNMFDCEHEISKRLASDRGINEKEMFYFLCECYGVYSENSVCLQVKLKPLNSDKFIPKLALFFKEYIPKLMNEISYESQKGSVDCT